MRSNTKVVISIFSVLKHLFPGDTYNYQVSFILSFIIKLIHRLYLYQKRKSLSTYALLPDKSMWKNSYPIILVHGFAGWVPDEAPLLGDYFGYASECAGDLEVYQADVSPWGSVHDRACELY